MRWIYQPDRGWLKGSISNSTDNLTGKRQQVLLFRLFDRRKIVCLSCCFRNRSYQWQILIFRILFHYGFQRIEEKVSKISKLFLNHTQREVKSWVYWSSYCFMGNWINQRVLLTNLEIYESGLKLGQRPFSKYHSHKWPTLPRSSKA